MGDWWVTVTVQGQGQGWGSDGGVTHPRRDEQRGRAHAEPVHVDHAAARAVVVLGPRHAFGGHVRVVVPAARVVVGDEEESAVPSWARAHRLVCRKSDRKKRSSVRAVFPSEQGKAHEGRRGVVDGSIARLVSGVQVCLISFSPRRMSWHGWSSFAPSPVVWLEPMRGMTME